MTSETTSSSSSSIELKNALNSCLVVLMEPNISMPRPPAAASTPIYRRPVIAPPTQQTLEKQALTDAAHALSQLWNVRRGRRK